MASEITLADVFAALQVINRDINELKNKVNPFISRKEIVEIHGRTWYDTFADSGKALPIKNPGRNAKVIYFRADYQMYLLTLQS